MAAKNLSSLVTDNYSVGDMIWTNASTTRGGRTLLACDGSSFSSVTYPDLATALATRIGGFTLTPGDVSADGSSINDNAAFSYMEAPYTAIADNGDFITMDDENDAQFRKAAATAEVVTTTGVVTEQSAAIDNDGSHGLVVQSNQNASNDLKAWYTLTGQTSAWSSVNVEVADTMDGVVLAAVDSTGANGAIYAFNTTDSTIDRYDSGADLSSWSLSTAYSYSTPFTSVYDWQYTDDLAAAVVCTDKGAYFTTDSGVTWTEEFMPKDIVFDQTKYINTATINSSDLVVFGNYSASSILSHRLYKTSDKGSTYSEIFNSEEALLYLDGGDKYATAGFEKVRYDSSDGLWVCGPVSSGGGHATAGTMFSDALALWYSPDDGVTWTGRVVYNGPVSWHGGTIDYYGAGVIRIEASRDCSVWTFTLANAGTNARTYVFSGVTAGDYTPCISGNLKIVAD